MGAPEVLEGGAAGGAGGAAETEGAAGGASEENEELEGGAEVGDSRPPALEDPPEELSCGACRPLEDRSWLNVRRSDAASLLDTLMLSHTCSSRCISQFRDAEGQCRSTERSTCFSEQVWTKQPGLTQLAPRQWMKGVEGWGAHPSFFFVLNSRNSLRVLGSMRATPGFKSSASTCAYPPIFSCLQ